jgi:polyhydroxyalkanoate synthesis repressor PhaR
MSEPRVIKKYPNRRLYDTFESRYITLAEIRRLVLDKTDFMVVDKKTNQEITRSILLQVISEQEHQGAPVMSQEFLANVIRSYEEPSHELVGGYLDQSMRAFATQHQRSQERSETNSKS